MDDGGRAAVAAVPANSMSVDKSNARRSLDVCHAASASLLCHLLHCLTCPGYGKSSTGYSQYYYHEYLLNSYCHI